jgi:Leucine-rich repeat (LRR) protein
LRSRLPALRQLDLTDNLIGSWGTVSAVCAALPQLQQLNLSLNRLQGVPARLPPPPCSTLQQLPGLRCLVLSHCGLSWQQVSCASWLQRGMPLLECAVSMPAHALHEHTKRCPLAAQVAVLQSCLPHLEELHASGNDISCLRIHLAEEGGQQQQQQQQQEQQQQWPLLSGFKSLKVRLPGSAACAWAASLSQAAP